MQMSISQLGHLLLKQGLSQYQEKEKIKSENVSSSTPKSITKSLTSREIEILKLAAQGTSNKAIASGLGIREQTTKNHFSAILHKLNAQNRTQAVVLALSQNLVNTEN
jgi:DNA-binding NarL/FixJ family response regulator